MAARTQKASIYEHGLDRNSANFQPLTPLTFLEWSATVYPDQTAVVHGERRYSYREFYARCRRLASALSRRGVGLGDTVSVMAPNVPSMLECHYGVPMTGAVLNALNFRLDAGAIAFILDHGEARVLITDREFSGVIKEALGRIERDILVIDIDDELAEGGELLGEMDYEAFLEEGDPDYQWQPPDDEWQALALNYTSGTTGNPKGVVYHHRGAYLNALGNILAWSMPSHPNYLWTLPMFHCSGWCFPWAVTALAGTYLCLRKVEAGAIFRAIADERATHFCGAPIVLNMLIHATQQERRKFDHRVEVMTAAAPPQPAVLEAVEGMGFHVTHAYGLTEVYGPATVCAWHREWDGLSGDEQARLKARQGVRSPVLEEL
ncbi:MAG: AMP-binding protein, partial [Chloroflexi bacterium]|nr:AMP-binding protein [Chloroflexota bacterium]